MCEIIHIQRSKAEVWNNEPKKTLNNYNENGVCIRKL